MRLVVQCLNNICSPRALCIELPQTASTCLLTNERTTAAMESNHNAFFRRLNKPSEPPTLCIVKHKHKCSNATSLRTFCKDLTRPATHKGRTALASYHGTRYQLPTTKDYHHQMQTGLSCHKEDLCIGALPNMHLFVLQRW